MEGNEEVIEYALGLWGWGLHQVGNGTIGTSLYDFAIDMLNGYDT